MSVVLNNLHFLLTNSNAAVPMYIVSAVSFIPFEKWVSSPFLSTVGVLGTIIGLNSVESMLPQNNRLIGGFRMLMMGGTLVNTMSFGYKLFNVSFDSYLPPPNGFTTPEGNLRFNVNGYRLLFNDATPVFTHEMTSENISQTLTSVGWTNLGDIPRESSNMMNAIRAYSAVFFHTQTEGVCLIQRPGVELSEHILSVTL